MSKLIVRKHSMWYQNNIKDKWQLCHFLTIDRVSLFEVFIPQTSKSTVKYKRCVH
jgi:hypothetical protein